MNVKRFTGNARENINRKYTHQKTYYNYFYGFHGLLWKYFVESDLHKKYYKKVYNAKNCQALGSCKLDNYKFINKNNSSNIPR